MTLLYSGAARSAVIYTFSGTPGAGPSAGLETFTFTSRGFIGAVSPIPYQQLTNCLRCFGYMHFTPGTPSGSYGDSIQFGDVNLTAYSYYFPPGTFSTPGQHATIPTAPYNTNVGTLKVEVTDDLAVTNGAGFDFCGSAGGFCPTFGIAPGQIATIFGSDTIAAATEVATGTNLPNVLAGVSVTIVDSNHVSRVASLYFVSPTQINFLVPPDTALGDALIRVTTPKGPRLIATAVTATRPGIFTANANGTGIPAAQLIHVQADGSQTMENVFWWDTVAQQWIPKTIYFGNETVYLVLYGTGIQNSSDVRVNCWCTQAPGTMSLPVAYAGPQSQYPGLDQVNVLLPSVQWNQSYVQIWLTVGGIDSNPVRLSFR